MPSPTSMIVPSSSTRSSGSYFSISFLSTDVISSALIFMDVFTPELGLQHVVPDPPERGGYAPVRDHAIEPHDDPAHDLLPYDALEFALLREPSLEPAQQGCP